MALTVSFSKMICLMLLSMQVKGEIGGDFTDLPPEDYYHRRSLTDCPSRFYAHLPDHADLLDFDQESEIAAYNPHVAAVGWINNDTIEYLCNGVFISSKFILTTANCISKAKRKKPDTVRLGDGDLVSRNADGYSQHFNVRSFKQHPQFRQGRHYFDVALIELETEIPSNDVACPACLWLEEELPPDEMYAIDLGATNNSAINIGAITENRLSSIDMCICQERFPTFRRGLLENEFCAASDCMGTCQRNCVGALQIERPDIDGSMIPLIVGIESFTTSWPNNSIGLFSRVVSYRSWIEQEVGHSMDYQTCTRTSKCSARKRISSPIVLHKGYTSRVGLIWNDSELDAHQCGATLVDYRFAVTSAYCVQMRSTKLRFIVIENTREIVPIEQVIIHPEFCADKPQNDIALLKLSKFLKQGAQLVPTCLWLDGTKSEDWMLKVSAYGTSFAERDSYRKDNYDQYTVDFQPEDVQECDDLQQNRLHCLNNSLSLVPGACNIDFGGPVYNVSGKIVYLHGIVSHLSEDCEHDLLVIRVDVHIPWIVYNILDHSNDRAAPRFPDSASNPFSGYPNSGSPDGSFLQKLIFNNLHLPSIRELLSSVVQRFSFVRNIFSREMHTHNYSQKD